MKRILIACMLIMALAATCLTGCMNKPAENGETTNNGDGSQAVAAVFTVDVNPGVRVYLKADNTVMAVEATNADGETVVAELDVAGDDCETAIDEIVDAMESTGFITEEDNSVLISVEKTAEGITDTIDEKVNKAFEKRGKKAALIQQKLDELDEEVEDIIEELAEKYDISKGKAHIIEKLREEFPELSEEDLANLIIKDLALLLEETSEHVKGHFEKFEKPENDKYLEKYQAVYNALTSVELTEADVTELKAKLDREDGKMVYEVEFVYDETEYEIEVDAISGEILDTETEPVEENDVKGKLDKFCDDNKISYDKFHDHMKEQHKGDVEIDRVIFKGEAMKIVIKALAINGRDVEDTEAKVVEEEGCTVMLVTVEMENGDIYKAILDAYTGAIVSAELNGEAIEISTDVDTEADADIKEDGKAPAKPEDRPAMGDDEEAESTDDTANNDTAESGDTDNAVDIPNDAVDTPIDSNESLA